MISQAVLDIGAYEGFLGPIPDNWQWYFGTAWQSQETPFTYEEAVTFTAVDDNALQSLESRDFEVIISPLGKECQCRSHPWGRLVTTGRPSWSSGESFGDRQHNH